MTQAQQRRTAVVTGSARRVGRAIAVALVEDGWDVLVHARDAARAREACGEIGAAGWAGGWANTPPATVVASAKKKTSRRAF